MSRFFCLLIFWGRGFKTAVPFGRFTEIAYFCVALNAIDMSSESFIRLLSQPLAVSVIVCGAVAVALLLFLAYIDVKYYLRVYRFCRKNAEKSETRKKEFLPPVSLIVICPNFSNRIIPISRSWWSMMLLPMKLGIF